jgi:nitrogenase molybdenum-iron protein alpha/beta subunit
MTLRPSLSNSCRQGGCTLTGALSVTTHIRDAVTVVHGPKGCTHHNFSLLHATSLDNDELTLPDIISTGLGDTEIIFGGEVALQQTLDSVTRRDPAAVFVLSTCIVDTIGDDVQAVCDRDYCVPVIQIPTSGFLGGSFQDGLNNALCAIADNVGSLSRSGEDVAAVCPENYNGVNIIGEKNLEFEVEENYAEITRLLDALAIPVNSRFIRNSTVDALSRIGAARLNILRDQELLPTGEFLRKKFGTPYMVSYPSGLEGTIEFIRNVAEAFKVSGDEAVARERAMQEEMLAGFSDISGTEILFETFPTHESRLYSDEIIAHLGLKQGTRGCKVPLPFSPPVGSTGVRRLLHRWRCAIHG